MTMYVDDITVREVSSDGSLLYAVREFDFNENHPPGTELVDGNALRQIRDFDHHATVGEEHQPYEGEIGWGHMVIVLASSPSVAVFASMIKTYLRRHADREVRVGWQDGQPQLTIHGSYSVDEIERLIAAQLQSSNPEGLDRDGPETNDEHDVPDSDG